MQKGERTDGDGKEDREVDQRLLHRDAWDEGGEVKVYEDSSLARCIPGSLPNLFLYEDDEHSSFCPILKEYDRNDFWTVC